MDNEDIDLRLSFDEACVLSMHLGFITNHDVAEILRERKLTNDFDLGIVSAVRARLDDIAVRRAFGATVQLESASDLD